MLDRIRKLYEYLIAKPPVHQWHDWYAWYPVVMNNDKDYADIIALNMSFDVAWFVWIERKLVPITQNLNEVKYRRSRP